MEYKSLWDKLSFKWILTNKVNKIVDAHSFDFGDFTF